MDISGVWISGLDIQAPAGGVMHRRPRWWIEGPAACLDYWTGGSPQGLALHFKILFCKAAGCTWPLLVPWSSFQKTASQLKCSFTPRAHHNAPTCTPPTHPQARRLEEDLAAVQHTGSTPALRSAGASTTALGALVDPSLASSGAAASGLPSALPAALASAPSGTSLAGPAAAGAGGGEGGEPGASAAAGGAGGQQLLDIVVSQRDRFRQRMAQLEEEKGG